MSSRLLFHTLNGFGLGHLSRQVAIARAVRQFDPTVEILFATESSYGPTIAPEFPFFALPDGKQLKSEAWSGAGAGPRVRALMSVMDALVKGYRPGALVHDTMVWPPLFEAAAAARVRQAMVLRVRKNLDAYLRDPAMPPQRCDLLVLPYEPSTAPAVLRKLPRGLPPVAWVGDVGRQAGASVAETRRRLGLGEGIKLIVVTGGAGGFADAPDFYALAADALAAARSRLGTSCVVMVLGPAYEGPSPVIEGMTVLMWRELSWMPDVLAAADLVLCQAGHNTIAELRRAGSRGIIVPAHRNVDDQFERARDAANRSNQLDVFEGTDPEQLAVLIERSLAKPAPTRRTQGVKPKALRVRDLKKLIELGEVTSKTDPRKLPPLSKVVHHD